MSPVRVMVVGAGPMGRLHVRSLARRARVDPEVELAGVVDRNLDRAAELASEHGVVAAKDPLDLAAAVDAAVVAVPTAAHGRVASRLIEGGLDVLVEKPLAASVEEAEPLVALAQRSGRVLQVGHVEWYNPAWREAAARAGIPREIRVERCRPFERRGLDVDVVRDLMLHDLDWVQRLVGEEPLRIEARGRCVETDLVDDARATLHFGTGCVARLHASRVHPESLRRVRIEGAEGVGRADLLRPSAPVDDASMEAASGGGDPLDAQLVDFLAAIVSRDPPSSDGAVGLRALRTVERVLAAIAAGGSEPGR